MSSPRFEHTLWIGAAGTGTSYGICRSARRHFGSTLRIVAADIYPSHLVAASHIADVFEQVAPVASIEFASQLTEGFARHRVDSYHPVLDEEIVLAAQMAGDGRIPPAITVFAPNADVAAACLDKLETARRLQSAGLPSPRTEAVAQARWESGGMVVKPRKGRGSVGVQFLQSERQLDALRDDSTLIVQEACLTPEVTVDTFRSRTGAVFRAICRERIEVKAGVCTKARVFESEELELLARRLCEALDLSGAICFQVMRRRDGSWAITDVNPRPGAGTSMSAAVGVDTVHAALLDAWGGDPASAIPHLDGERFVVRSYSEHVFTVR